MKHFAVVGNPVAHSRSPEIHQAFAAQAGLAISYQRLEAPVTADDSGFVDTVRAFFAAGGSGVNVTAPFKDAAFRFASKVSERSRLAEAANTLTAPSIEEAVAPPPPPRAGEGGGGGEIDEQRQNQPLFPPSRPSPASGGRSNMHEALRQKAFATVSEKGAGGWQADNTDGVGLVRDLTGRLGLPLVGQRVLILGAGGASAGILGPLLEMRPSQMVLWNRSADKAQRLAHRFAAAYPDAALSAVSDFSAAQADGVAFDLVIHATSLKAASFPPCSHPAPFSKGAPPKAAGVCLPQAGEEGSIWPWLKLLCTPDAFFYDLSYADNEETLFLGWAKACGACRWSDGFGMLVEQAAESFRIWHGCLPETKPVFAALRPKK